MSFSARILAHSTFRGGTPLTTFELRYPRMIHPEVMTYRVFARNASSSRAVPISKMIQDIKADTAKPIRWGKNGKGMQDHGLMSPEAQVKAERLWMKARDSALRIAGEMIAMGDEGPHKQIVNRLLEPFGHITVVLTSNRWANFYVQRRHPDAQPEIKHLADLMWEAQSQSTPKMLEPGDWHLPYVQDFERLALFDLPEDQREDGMLSLIKVSVARCARTSYRTFQGKVSTFEEDMALYDKLAGSVPLHASPAEHQATPDTFKIDMSGPKPRKVWEQPELHGNLPGYVQNRKTLPNENITNYTPEA